MVHWRMLLIKKKYLYATSQEAHTLFVLEPINISCRNGIPHNPIMWHSLF